MHIGSLGVFLPSPHSNGMQSARTGRERGAHVSGLSEAMSVL